jgi:hypothetical protein
MKTHFIVKEPYVICLIKDRKLRRRFKGLAKCDPRDEFDVEKGKKIAQLKAEINREKYRFKSVEKDIRQIDKYTNGLKRECYNRMSIFDENMSKKYDELSSYI